jgi:hypothetical protein
MIRSTTSAGIRPALLKRRAASLIGLGARIHRL